MKVYEGNWSAKTRDHFIRRIKMKQKEIDQDIVIEMFYHLKGSYGESKWVTKPLENLKSINFYVCNLIWTEN